MEDDRNDGVQSSTGDAGNGLNLEALFNTSMATPFWVAVFFILASFVIFKKRSSVAGPFVFRDLSGYLTTVRGMFQSARNAQSSKSTSTASSGSDSEGSALITASETSTAAISSSSSTDSMVISSSTDSMVVQDSGLLHLPLQIIARIANGLDARSLIHLASSCRLLHRFLRQPSRRNGVEVQISFPVLFRVAWDLREKLEIWPFACHIDWLMTSPDTFHGDLECLRRIHAKTIEKVEPRDGGLVDYQDLRNMIIIGFGSYVWPNSLFQEFNVQKVHLNMNADEDYSEEERKELLQMPLESLYVRLEDVSFLRFVSIHELYLGDCVADRNDIRQIIKMIVTTNIRVDWLIGLEEFCEAEYLASLSDYIQLHQDFSGPLPQDRPLAVFGPDPNRLPNDGDIHLHFYIRREDGLVVHVSYIDLAVQICVIPVTEAPAICTRIV